MCRGEEKKRINSVCVRVKSTRKKADVVNGTIAKSGLHN